jgi:hypothetical protein
MYKSKACVTSAAVGKNYVLGPYLLVGLSCILYNSEMR